MLGRNITKYQSKDFHALAVDDNSLILMDLEYLLYAAGATKVSAVGDIKSALKLLAENPPDIAVIEYALGGQITEKLAQGLMRRKIPFAYVTGAARHELPADVAHVPFLSKPYLQADFEDMVKSLLDRRAVKD